MRRIALAAAAMCACVSVPAASAGSGVRITGIDAKSYPEVELTVSAPAGARPRVSEDATPVALSHAVSFAAGKAVVLAVDRSHSMAGASLRNAVRAAHTLVGTLGSVDDVETIAFGHNARVLSPSFAGKEAANASLSTLKVDNVQGTALWDAVVLAARGLSTEAPGKGRAIVVVTDGRDVSSRATLDLAEKAVRAAHATVYTVGIASPDFTAAPLRELAAATGGGFMQTSSSAGLASLYRSIGGSLARTWQLEYTTNANPGQAVNISVSVPGGAGVARTFTLPGVPTAPAPPPVLSSSVWTSKLAPLVLAGVVGLLAVVAALFGLNGLRRSWLVLRLEPHLAPARRRKSGRREAMLAWPKRLSAATERAFANVKQFRALQRMIARADMPILAAELVYACVATALLFAVVAALLGAGGGVAFLIGLVGLSTPVVAVWLKARARIRAFDEQLPDLLTTIAASLKAGHSFRHAIQAVVDEGAEPAALEFRRVLTEARLGKSMDDALGDLADRVGSKNLSFALTAVTIQRHVGGSLAGLFDMVADTVRQRQQFARKIRALTAMGRMSAYVLIALPFVVAVCVSALNHHYMAPLWQTPQGHELVGAGLVMIVIGSVILKRIVSFRG